MKQYFALGSYTEDILFGTGEIFHGKGNGITVCCLEEGQIRAVRELKLSNPSFLCIEEGLHKIYAVNELKEFRGQFGGGLTRIAYGEDGTMRVEESVPTGGTDPCHVAVSPDKTFLSVANFASGSVMAVPLDGNGDFGGEGRLFCHRGHSVHPVRQRGPHAHSTIFAPDRRRMYVPDLGLDRLAAYSYQEGTVSEDKGNSVDVAAGSGPRYGEFDRAGRNFYLIDEISSQVQHFSYEEGTLTPRETVSTLPEDYTGDNICSDLHITPDGAFLFASNRGHDSLACFHIESDGGLRLQGYTQSGGKTPRNFAIDPSGSYLLAGNQDSDSITVFSIGAGGELTQVSRFETGSPVCIRFFTEGLHPDR